jgi:hypothetical protein
MTRRTRGDVQDIFLAGNPDRPKASNSFIGAFAASAITTFTVRLKIRYFSEFFAVTSANRPFTFADPNAATFLNSFVKSLTLFGGSERSDHQWVLKDTKS